MEATKILNKAYDEHSMKPKEIKKTIHYQDKHRTTSDKSIQRDDIRVEINNILVDMQKEISEMPYRNIRYDDSPAKYSKNMRKKSRELEMLFKRLKHYYYC